MSDVAGKGARERSSAAGAAEIQWSARGRATRLRVKLRRVERLRRAKHRRVRAGLALVTRVGASKPGGAQVSSKNKEE